MNILFVSDYHHFSTKDIYEGYVDAFNKLEGVNVDFARVDDLRQGYFNDDVTWSLAFTKMMRVDNGYTHIVFLSGFSIPEWVIKSKYDKKYALIALDDPHSSLRTLAFKKYLDYYFTNEKTLEDEPSGIYYVPTASSTKVPSCTKSDVPEHLRSDVVFVGTVYPNRLSILNTVAEHCIANGLKFRCVGVSNHITEEMPLYECYENRIVSSMEAKLLYRGSRLVINIDRDVNYKQDSDTNPYLIKRDEEAYSLNPRSYEVALSRTPQLFVNPRGEANDIFGENALYCDDKRDNVVGAIDKAMTLPVNSLKKIVKGAYDVVLQNHTYDNRVKKIVEIMNRKE